MTVVGTIYDLPREKLQKRGAVHLTNAELLQIIIGSGNAQASVARIAKRTMKLLARQGSEVTYEQLVTVAGLGPARACQIIAAFELASRYPATQRQLTIDTPDKIISLMTDIQLSKVTKLTYLTVDGARRLIAKRTLLISDKTHPSSLLRTIFRDVTSDNAAGLIIGMGETDRELIPSMFDLSFARDLRVMAQLFLVSIHDLILINEEGHHSLKRTP